MLTRHITAELRRMRGYYPHLEGLLPSLTPEQQRDLLNALKAAKEAGKSEVQGRARRMGFPPGFIR